MRRKYSEGLHYQLNYLDVWLFILRPFRRIFSSFDDVRVQILHSTNVYRNFLLRIFSSLFSVFKPYQLSSKITHFRISFICSFKDFFVFRSFFHSKTFSYFVHFFIHIFGFFSHSFHFKAKKYCFLLKIQKLFVIIDRRWFLNCRLFSFANFYHIFVVVVKFFAQNKRIIIIQPLS